MTRDDLENDEVFSTAINGLPKVIELITATPEENVRLHWRPRIELISGLRKNSAMTKAMLSNGHRRSCPSS